jgi:MFS family permease
MKKTNTRKINQRVILLALVCWVCGHLLITQFVASPAQALSIPGLSQTPSAVLAAYVLPIPVCLGLLLDACCGYLCAAWAPHFKMAHAILLGMLASLACLLAVVWEKAGATPWTTLYIGFAWQAALLGALFWVKYRNNGYDPKPEIETGPPTSSGTS